MMAVAAGVGVLVLALGAFAVYWVFSGSGGGQWREFAPTEGGFSVLMPTVPDQNERTDPKLVTASRIREHVAQGRKASYTVQYFDLPDKPYNNFVYFGWYKNHLLSGGGKLAREQDVSQGSYAGKEVTVVDLPDDQVLVRRMYLAEARVFWLTARYSRSSPVDPQKFFDSFKISGVAKAKSTPPLVAEGPKPPEPPPSPSPATTRPSPPTNGMPQATVPDRPPQPPPMPPPMPPNNPAAFPTSAEEQALVDAVNRLRASANVPALTPQQKLFEVARARSNALAQNLAQPEAAETGYSVNNFLSIPSRGISAQQLIDELGKQKAFRGQLVDDDVQFIGVGVVTDKNGLARNVLFLAGNPK
jgi:hypothetical protein